MNKHPIQPLAKDSAGVLRFKKNHIVCDLLEVASQHGLSLNDLACRDYSPDDRQQLAQLIGYSLSGYGDLGYVDNEAYAAAEKRSKKAKKSDDAIRAEHLRAELKSIRRALRVSTAKIFGIHPDDLGAE